MEQQTLEVMFARLEGKVDIALTQHGERISQLHEAKNDHEARIREMEKNQDCENEERVTRLERTKYWLAGAAAAVGSILTFAMQNLPMFQ